MIFYTNNNLFFRKLLTIPWKLNDENQTIFSQCEMYDTNFTNIINLNMTNLNSSWPIKKCDNGWTFDYTDVPYASISAEVFIKLLNNYDKYFYFINIIIINNLA